MGRLAREADHKGIDRKGRRLPHINPTKDRAGQG